MTVEQYIRNMILSNKGLSQDDTDTIIDDIYSQNTFLANIMQNEVAPYSRSILLAIHTVVADMINDIK